MPNYSQSADRLDEIIEELAAILHPERFPGYCRKFFTELPETDPPAGDSEQTVLK